jgi:hypothetical protein
MSRLVGWGFCVDRYPLGLNAFCLTLPPAWVGRRVRGGLFRFIPLLRIPIRSLWGSGMITAYMIYVRSIFFGSSYWLCRCCMTRSSSSLHTRSGHVRIHRLIAHSLYWLGSGMIRATRQQTPNRCGLQAR